MEGSSSGSPELDVRLSWRCPNGARGEGPSLEWADRAAGPSQRQAMQAMVSGAHQPAAKWGLQASSVRSGSPGLPSWEVTWVQLAGGQGQGRSSGLPKGSSLAMPLPS